MKYECNDELEKCKGRVFFYIVSSQLDHSRSMCYALVKFTVSLLLYEPYANVSSQICPFLAMRPQFHSKNRVNLSTPRSCQSDTFGRLTFCFYPFIFTEFVFNVATPTARTPRPPRKPLCGKLGLHAEL